MFTELENGYTNTMSNSLPCLETHPGSKSCTLSKQAAERIHALFLCLF